jgi:hypothetical protein
VNFLRVVFVLFVLMQGHIPSAHALSVKATFAADIFFESGSAKLTSAATSRLDSFAKLVGGSAVEAVIAVGHADASEANAQTLSEARAIAVKKYLMMLGFAPQIFYTEGRGSKGMLKPTETLSIERVRSHARVEIEWMGLHGTGLAAYFRLYNSWKWFDGASIATSLSHADKALNAYHPLAFANEIVDLKKRERFLTQLIMIAVLRGKDDQVALFSKYLHACTHTISGESESERVLPNPYQFALIFGSTNQQALLSHCKPSVPSSKGSVLQLLVGNYCHTKSNQRMPVENMAQQLDWQEGKLLQREWQIDDLHACVQANPSAARWLIKQGADVDARDRLGFRALEKWVRRADLEKVKLLLQAGANPNLRIQSDNQTVLHLINDLKHCEAMVPCRHAQLTVKSQLWSLLIDHGADPSMKDSWGKQPVKP